MPETHQDFADRYIKNVDKGFLSKLVGDRIGSGDGQRRTSSEHWVSDTTDTDEDGFVTREEIISFNNYKVPRSIFIGVLNVLVIDLYT